MADPAEALAVARFCQPIYAATYPNTKYGLTTEHFSKAIFEDSDTVEYFAHTLEASKYQQAYLAKVSGQIVGCISIERQKDYCEIHAFYVGLEWQGKGIGRRLLQKALEFSALHWGDLPVRVEVAETNTKSIAQYMHWGFKLAPTYGMNWRHWPEWPAEVKNAYMYMQATREDLKV